MLPEIRTSEHGIGTWTSTQQIACNVPGVHVWHMTQVHGWSHDSVRHQITLCSNCQLSLTTKEDIENEIIMTIRICSKTSFWLKLQIKSFNLQCTTIKRNGDGSYQTSWHLIRWMVLPQKCIASTPGRALPKLLLYWRKRNLIIHASSEHTHRTCQKWDT